MNRVPMQQQKKIALVAHDGRKQELLEWVQLAVLDNIPTASNHATADFLISSSFLAPRSNWHSTQKQHSKHRYKSP